MAKRLDFHTQKALCQEEAGDRMGVHLGFGGAVGGVGADDSGVSRKMSSQNDRTLKPMLPFYLGK